MGGLVQQSPPPPQLRVERTVTDRVVMWVLRPLWAWRTELVLVGAPAGVAVALSAVLDPAVATVLAIALVVGCVRIGTCRRWLGLRLSVARLRRFWTRAVRYAELATINDRVPRITKVTPVPCGWAMTVSVPRGAKVSDLEEAAEAVAACMQVRDVRVTREVSNARLAQVVVVRRDPLADTGPLAWPHVDAPRLSLWEPVPVGVDEDGEVVTVSLPERNVLLGGEPGAGKSAALSMLVATAALDPSVNLTLLDGKLVELAAWSGCAQRSVGVDVAEAIDVLRGLQAEMERRYARLLADGRRKVGPGDGLALHVVVCDELAHYLTAPDRKQRGEFAEVMRDLVSRGRAAGVVVLGATQKPSADVIPTALRDLFGFRWALRCSTPQASDTILGQGWASQGFNAAGVD
ncbi:MAG: FtsK/SpoIIIE domain-containing protein, partial [Actinomycetota bacterium]|nr:FtsK/SpoIIIE domain-containing protein [Actinomycetota bacterium]